MAKRTATKKGLKTWQKVALVGGAGLGVYALVSSMTKPQEQETQYAPDPTATTPQYTAPEITAPVIVPPATVEPTALEKSYKSVNDYFALTGLPIIKYGDHIELALTYNGLPRKIQFWNNGRFMFYWRANSTDTWKTSAKGNFTAGGQILTITDGVKAGQIKNGQDVLMNIKNAML